MNLVELGLVAEMNLVELGLVAEMNLVDSNWPDGGGYVVAYMDSDWW